MSEMNEFNYVFVKNAKEIAKLNDFDWNIEDNDLTLQNIDSVFEGKRERVPNNRTIEFITTFCKGNTELQEHLLNELYDGYLERDILNRNYNKNHFRIGQYFDKALSLIYIINDFRILEEISECPINNELFDYSNEIELENRVCSEEVWNKLDEQEKKLLLRETSSVFSL